MYVHTVYSVTHAENVRIRHVEKVSNILHMGWLVHSIVRSF